MWEYNQDLQSVISTMFIAYVATLLVVGLAACMCATESEQAANDRRLGPLVDKLEALIEQNENTNLEIFHESPGRGQKSITTHIKLRPLSRQTNP